MVWHTHLEWWHYSISDLFLSSTFPFNSTIQTASSSSRLLLSVIWWCLLGILVLIAPFQSVVIWTVSAESAIQISEFVNFRSVIPSKILILYTSSCLAIFVFSILLLTLLKKISEHLFLLSSVSQHLTAICPNLLEW